MSKFILFIREDLSRYPLPKDTLETLIKAHTNWAKDLASRGVFIDGYGLESAGFLIEKKGGKLVENKLRDVKEGIGGFYIIKAENIDEAKAIASECPTFDEGDLIEVRPLM